MRSECSVFRVGLLSNLRMNLAFIAGVLLQTAVIMLEPLNAVFHTSPMGGMQWAITAVLSVVPLAVIELQKQAAGQNKDC